MPDEVPVMHRDPSSATDIPSGVHATRYMMCECVWVGGWGLISKDPTLDLLRINVQMDKIQMARVYKGIYQMSSRCYCPPPASRPKITIL